MVDDAGGSGAAGMTRDAFVSYSSNDRAIADAVVERLENGGVRCWIAPRDIGAGQDWSASIPPAIDECAVFILILSPSSNDSQQVAREVHIAQAVPGKLVIPFRVEPVEPKGALRYLLSGLHWLDATGPDRESKIDELLERVRGSAPGGEPPEPPQRMKATVAPSNIPAEANAFVGRESELASLKSDLRSHPVVSLVGTGGVGKTRLALQAARETLSDFPDGAWFVELAAIVDPKLVASTIMDALGITESASQDRSEGLLSHLASKKLLLVVDNCEQVLDASAGIVADIARKCPGVRVLCTTRAPLGTPGEFVVRLQPLPLPEAAHGAPTVAELESSPAARLLLARAAAIAPVSLESPAARAAVSDICRRLDGLPLALELAAARTNVLSFEQISASIDKRFKLLTGGSRTAQPRQQTLGALIAWSYDLLDEDERTLFRRMAIFRGGCTLESATAVCSDESMDEWRVLDLLASLADKSLLVVESGGSRKRYDQMESIREYARERLVEGNEFSAIAPRHAVTFSEIARAAYEEWDTAPRPEWLSQLSPELDNFRAALSFDVEGNGDAERGLGTAAALGPVFLRMSLLREGIEWCERALLAAPNAPPQIQARAQYVLSMLHYNRGETKRAVDAAERAAALYEQTSDERGDTRALSQLVQLYQRVSRGDEARALAPRAVARARALGDERLLAAVLQRCATAFEPRDIERARAQFSECLSIFRIAGTKDDVARALIWWSSAEAEAECYREARDLSLEALAYAVTSDADMVLKSNLAFFSLALDDEENAGRYAREALALAAQARNPMLVPIAISYIAVVLHDDRPERGARLLGYAEARLAALERTDTPGERKIHARLRAPLRANFSDAQWKALLEEGAAWNEDQAVEYALEPEPQHGATT